jgi:hypothetical protein
MIWIVVCSVLLGSLLGALISRGMRHASPRNTLPGLTSPTIAYKPGLAPAPPRRSASSVGATFAPAATPSTESAPPASQPASIPESMLTRWTKSQGPYELDGTNFTVKTEWTCGKFDKSKNHCDDNWGETAASYTLLDAQGQTQFQRTFPYDGNPDEGCLRVSAVLLQGRSHQALQLIMSESPSAPNTGETSDFLAVHNGKLLALAEDIPVDAIGKPTGTAVQTSKLPANDAFPVRYFGALYYNRIAHMRFDWNAGRLAQVESNEFAIEPNLSQQPPDGAVDFYPAPDSTKASVRVHLAAETKIKFLSVVRSSTSQDASGKAIVTEWLKVSIDGRLGYVTGGADWQAIGLAPVD